MVSQSTRRLQALGSIILAIFSLLIILFSNPLFATLGFEYSALAALVLSLVCGIAGAAQRPGTGATFRTRLVATTIASACFSVVPLVISILSLPFLPNCAFGDGLVFYLDIALPSAVFGGWFGLAIHQIVRRRAWAIFTFVVFWLITLFLSLLPGYTNPQLFAYGWQYGFFPGFVWDPAITLTLAYWASRIEQAVWVALLFAIAAVLLRPQNASRKALWVFSSLAALAIVLFLLRDELGITSSHAKVEQTLSQRIEPAKNCSVYFEPGSLTDDEQERIAMDVRWFLFDIQRRFALPTNHPLIQIYVYPSDKSMLRFVGTRIASISKPWLNEVDISKGHLESLKHELTHVLLRPIGVFPFYASWSTGLTEGAAMSVEPEYDGIYTLDEHAARILQLHYARGVKQVMSFTGFAANASEKSYVLAGSFARFLLNTYGPQPFDRVYSSLDWQKEYGKPFDSLQSQWERSLAPLITPMTAGDTAHFQYYYDRTAIIFHPCLRRIGKLERSAAHAFFNRNYIEAGRDYRQAFEEGGGIEALAGLSDVLLRQHKLNEAITLFDTARLSKGQNQMIGLALRRGDLRAIAGDSTIADSLYDLALSAKLSGAEFLRAFAHKVLLHSNVQTEWLEFLKQEYMPDSVRYANDSASIFEAFLQVWMHHHPRPGFDRADLVLRYLYSTLLEQKGELAGAAHSDPFAIQNPVGHLDSEVLSVNDSLAVSQIALHFARISVEYSQAVDELDLAVHDAPEKFRLAITEAAEEVAEELHIEAGATSAEQPDPGTSP